MKNFITKLDLLLFTCIYTLTTILNSVIYLIKGIESDPSGNWHEIDRFLIILIGFLAFKLYDKLKLKNKIIHILISYIPSMLLTFFYVWLAGFRYELAPSAYKDIFICYTSCFFIFIILYEIVKKVRKK